MRQMGRTAQSASFSFPEGTLEEFENTARSLGFKNRSEYLRALHEAAKHYALRTTVHPETLERVLRRLPEVEGETRRGRQGGQPGKDAPLGR